MGLALLYACAAGAVLSLIAAGALYLACRVLDACAAGEDDDWPDTDGGSANPLYV